MNVRTRFAPSPTGTPESLHLGFVIRALWNYAYAKNNNGQFLLRIEDTDQKRSRKDTEEAIYATLKKFGINWDEGPDVGGPHGPYRQSQRLDKYKQAAKILVEKGYAYYDFDAQVREKEDIKAAYESEEKRASLQTRPVARHLDPNESRARVEAGEPYVVRVKIPEDKVFEYEDWILKKKIKILGKYVPDLIILKSDGFPTYHLAVVVDDIDMQITHVFRGQEWITSTPIHLFLYEAFEQAAPHIGHFTVILDPRTGKKFSKRDLTAMFGVQHWLDQGYLPEAIINYLMLLGWAPKDNKELFSLDEFIHQFDQSGVQKANPTFNIEKLNWFNGQYIRTKPNAEIIDLVKPFIKDQDTKIDDIVPLIKDRLIKLADINQLIEPFFVSPKFDPSLWANPQASRDHLAMAKEKLTLVAWDKQAIESTLVDEVKARGWKNGDFFMSMRIAIYGSKFTPPLTDTMLVLGRVQSIDRIDNALNALQT